MDDEGTVTYFAEIVATRGGKEVRLGRRAQGASVGELAAGLGAQASELESAANEQLDRAETEEGKRQRAELSGRPRRSWE